MGIDPKTEQPTRKLLGHAIRHELDELAASARSHGAEALLGSIPLCLLASAYIAIDVSDRWPTEADLREIAKSSAESVTRLDITEQEIYAYLSRVALGPEKLDDVFSVEGLATIRSSPPSFSAPAKPPPRRHQLSRKLSDLPYGERWRRELRIARSLAAHPNGERPRRDFAHPAGRAYRRIGRNLAVDLWLEEGANHPVRHQLDRLLYGRLTWSRRRIIWTGQQGR